MSILLLLKTLAVLKGFLESLSMLLMKTWGTVVLRNPTMPWKFRFFLSKRLSIRSAAVCFPLSLVDCDVSFINLAARKDRLVEFREEFARLGLPIAHRFEAVEMPNRMLGAAKSHHAAIAAAAARRPGEIIGVCEDDLQFLVGKEQLDECFAEFARNPYLDVLCLGFMVKNSSHKRKTVEIAVGKLLVASNNVMTQSCYFLKPRAIGPVLKSLETSATLLARGFPWRYAAGDVYWQRLQQGRLTFAIPSFRVARQRAGFSDIWQSHKDIAV